MNQSDIPHMRLQNQHISNPDLNKPIDVVRSLGAVQAQDYLGALWAIGLRMKTSSEADIEKAITDGSIVRSWPMRGTLHFVPAEDLRWMLDLLTPRVIQRSAALYKEVELDKKVFAKCRKTLSAALRNGKQLTRKELYAALETYGISTRNQRGLHILGHLAQEGLICFGPRQGKQQTFVLVDEWVPPTKMRTREEALSKLTMNYFTGHGPATLHDFSWWSGLTMTEVKKAIDTLKKHLRQELINGQTYWMSSQQEKAKSPNRIFLLPDYDEYLVAYKDRSAAIDARYVEDIKRFGNGIFTSQVVVDGLIAGTWKRTLTKDRVSIKANLFTPLSKSMDKALTTVAREYGKFLDIPVTLSSSGHQK